MSASSKRGIFHIGLPRAASTYLQRMVFEQADGHALSYQPNGIKGMLREVFRQYIPQSGAEVICDPDLDQMVIERLRQAITEAPGEIVLVSWGRPCGRWWLDFSDSKQAIGIVHRIWPDAELLIILREQVGWLASIYRYRVANGIAASLQNFLGWNGQRFVRTETADRWQGDRINTLEFDWSRLCEAVVERFGPKRFHLLTYEQLNSRPESFRIAMAEVLGHDLEVPITDHKANGSMPAANTHLLLAINKVVGAFGRIDRPTRLQRGARRILKRIPGPNYEIFETTIRTALKDHYRSTNQRLRPLLEEECFSPYAYEA